jgi:hypothetical protein
MRNGVVISEPIELCIVHPQNRLLIENHAGSIVIRAAQDNFSLREKTFFIRYLAAEGYIPQRYEWFADAETVPFSGLTWLVDSSWLKQSEPQRTALRQIVRLIFGALLFWLALMTLAFLHKTR